MCDFRQIRLQKIFRKFLFRCMGWFSLKLWEVLWFPKKKTITFFWSKLSKLHKKDPILHVATSFSLKQGETRTSHGPIPHPINILLKRWGSSLSCHRFGICIFYATYNFDKVETFWIVFKFALKCTQIDYFNDVMSDPRHR